MAEKQNVPGTSFDEVKKIIQGYASSKDAMSREDVSKKTSIDSASISRNGKFLVDLGLVDGKTKKKATETGRKYARALEHGQEEVAKNLLANMVKESEFLSDLVTTIRIKDGMGSDEFAAHVLYAADQSSNSHNKTGANTIRDMLVASGLVNDVDGNLKVATAVPAEEEEPPKEEPADINQPENAGASGKPEVKEKVVYRDSGGKHPHVTINVTLQIPEVDDPDVYDRFFKAMKTNLFPDD